MVEADLLGRALLLLGSLAVLVGIGANRYHSRRFKQHVDTLERLNADNQEAAIAKEVKRFSEDRRVDLAIHLLLLEQLGVFLVLVGAALLWF